MFSHRRSRPHRRQAAGLSGPLADRLEALEPRCLLTTLVGPGMGTYIDPVTDIEYTYPLISSWTYRDAADHVFRITLGGNVVAEFIGASVSDTNVVTLGNLVSEDAVDPNDPNQPMPGVDLFAVYVEEADLDAFITIVEQETDTQTGRITFVPFAENAGPIRIANTRGDSVEVNSAEDTGRLYLGARTREITDVENSGNIPITEVRLTRRIGILPLAAGDILEAGLTVKDGQDLGKFMFGGTVTGRVTVGGSMNLFYAGQLLTGITRGTEVSSMPNREAENFYVKGDLRDLIVKGSIGTDEGSGLDNPAYVTRFELRVDGRLGQVRAYDSFVGIVHVLGNQGLTANTRCQTEIEARGADLNARPTRQLTFANGYLNDDATTTFYNDTLATAQYLGTINSADLGEDNVIQVRGTLASSGEPDELDPVDYYAVGLLAGQTIEIQMLDLDALEEQLLDPEMEYVSSLNLGVFDPEGRLIATDYSDVDPLNTEGQPFRITADRAGLYYFAIGRAGEYAFGTTPGSETSATTAPYELRISNVGPVTLGAVAAANTIYESDLEQNGFLLESGDFGALVAGGNLMGEDAKTLPLDPDELPPVTVAVLDGNLRVVQGQEIGQPSQVTGDPISGVNLHVPAGTVGLVQSTTGVLALNDTYLPELSSELAQPFVGKDYQMIDAAGRFYGNVIANRSIGVIRAGDMGTRVPSVIVANADVTGDDGVIDLIDTGGDFGSLIGGGPHITTGPKGNVRYISVGGTVYRDEAFGSGNREGTQFSPGQPAYLTDDSGASLTISPASGLGQLYVVTYGIRGSGGVVVVSVSADSSLTITGTSQSDLAGVEIGTVTMSAGGTLTVGGRGRVDILRIIGGDFQSIRNSTPGEIVTVQAGQIGTIEAQTLGIATTRTACAVLPLSLLAGALDPNNPANYPFDRLRTGISADSIQNVLARGALGNILVTGTIDRVTANSDRVSAAGAFEGIVAPVYAGGAIGQVQAGAGILSSGNGNAARSGVFSGNTIGAVTADRGADIRGNIVARTQIGTIRLVDGSIINANIFVGDLADSREFITRRPLPEGNDTLNRPVFEIGEISVKGGGQTSAASGGSSASKGKRQYVDLRNRRKAAKKAAKSSSQFLPGGIIGANIAGADIGTVKVSGGFGILNSEFHVLPDGVIERIEGDGYGLRDLIIDSGARVGAIVAVGDGSAVAVNKFSQSVRLSEQADDPSMQYAPNRLTDLYKFFGLSRRKPSVKGITQRGYISGASASGSRDLGILQAYRLEGGTTSAGQGTFGSVFNFANSINSIDIKQDINAVQIVAGRIKQFNVAGNVVDLNMTIAGPIDSIKVGRNFNATSVIHAIGPDGRIGSILIGKDFAGQITAELSIGKITVKGRFTGTIVENGKPVRK